MNMQIPVGVIARLIPFHDAIMVYFWRAVSGNRGSGAAGGGGSLGPSVFWPSDLQLDEASLPSSQPMVFFFYGVTMFVYVCVGCIGSDFIFLVRAFNATARICVCCRVCCEFC